MMMPTAAMIGIAKKIASGTDQSIILAPTSGPNHVSTIGVLIVAGLPKKSVFVGSSVMVEMFNMRCSVTAQNAPIMNNAP